MNSKILRQPGYLLFSS